MIRLGNCFDLVDPVNVEILREFYKQMIADMQASGETPPVNVRSHRNLDCAVFNYMYRISQEVKQPLDAARAIFVPTSKSKRVYAGSWISEEIHIQVCVRNPKNILAVWHVRKDGRYGKDSS